MINTSLAQSLDSSYTVPPPVDYVFPFVLDAGEVVGAAAAEKEDLYRLNFDTTSAYHIQQTSLDFDYIPHVTNEVIIDRLQCIQQKIPLNFNDKVRLFIDYFSVRERDYTLRILQKKNIYFPIFERILAEEGMPDELKYLSIVESALVPHALSRAGAKGLWQFMPYTGRQFGLKQDYYIDERMNPEKSTRAACKYLKSLYEQFGDWELAIAAYNCGPGNIRKAIRRSGKFHFWDIYHNLPKETRSYLPQFVAVMYTLNYAEEHNIIQEQPLFPIPYSEVYVNQSIDLKKLSKELNVCFEDLQELNPELRLGIVPSSIKNYPLRIPTERLEYFLNYQENILAASKFTGEEYRPMSKNNGSAIQHIVSKGETLSGIAKMYGVRLSLLKEWNGIYNNNLRIGQKLIVFSPTTMSKKNFSSMANTKTKPLMQQLKNSDVVSKQTNNSKSEGNKFYTVQDGDTLWGISQKFEGLTVQRIKQLNQLHSNKLTPGQKLKVD
ncbi:MAG: lytic transglycosylase domain-containing protein [Flammeovirgaceae bacterium]